MTDLYSWLPRRTPSAANKLTADEVRAIRRAYKEGVKQKDLATAYSVSRTAIHEVVTYQTWVNVTDEG